MNLSLWKRLFHTQYGIPVGIAITCHAILMALALPLLPIAISDRVGLDKLEVTAFYLIHTLSSIVVTLGTGYLSDGIISRYKLVLGAGLTASVGYLGIALATEPIHVFIVNPMLVPFLVLFAQMFAVARGGIVEDWEPEAQVQGITALRTLFSFGFILGTAMSSLFVQVIDLQVIFFIIAIALLVLTAYIGKILYSIEAYIAERSTRSVEIADQSTTREVPLPVYALIAPLAALVVLQGANSTRGVYLSLVMFDLFHNESIAAIMFGITATAELVTMGLIAYLSTQIGEKKAIAFSALSGTGYFLIIALSQSLVVLYPAQALYAIYLAALLGVSMAYIQRLLSHRIGLGGSLYMAVANMGSLIGILSPLVVEGYDQSIFIIPAILCIVGAIMLMVGDRTAQIQQRVTTVVQQATIQ